MADPTSRSARARLSLLVISIIGVIAVVAVLAFGQGPDPADRDALLVGANDFEFSTQSLRAEAGEIAVAFANTDGVPHTFTISELGLDELLGGGEARQFTFSAEPGRYEFICTIPGHDSPGMRGVLTVTPPSRR